MVHDTPETTSIPLPQTFNERGDTAMTDIKPSDVIDSTTSLPTPRPIKAKEAKEALDNDFLHHLTSRQRGYLGV
jgi:hypothetical protein